MKNRILKIIALTMALLLSFSIPACAYEKDEVKRVSVSMYGDGATGRGFCWFTEGKTNADLQIVKTDDFDGSYDNAATYTGKTTRYRGQYSHQVAVTDLEPGAAYTYRVGDAKKNVWSDDCSFLTDDGDSAFSFITIADVQAHTQENFEKSALTLKGALQTLPLAEFVVNLGDFVDDNTNEEWDWYFQSFKPYNDILTCVPVAGNHDGNITNKLNTNCFKRTFCLDRSQNRSLEGVYYSFDYGNAHFAVLNTNDMYPMSQAQRNWLINDMTASNARWKILLMHRSLYSAGKNINKPDTIIMRNILLPIIDTLDIDLVLSGHDHMYLRTSPVKGDRRAQDLTYVTERFGNEETAFALNPDGTVYAMPSTAGAKRYTVNENAIRPILQVADVALSTRGIGGTFATTEVEDDRLIYKAYTVDDETGEIVQIDQFAIKKTEVSEMEARHLDQSFFSSVYSCVVNFFVAIGKMAVSYLNLWKQVHAK